MPNKHGRGSGLVVCSWHPERYNNGHNRDHRWCFVFRRRSVRQRFRIVYLKSELIYSRIISHGICYQCAQAQRMKNGLV